MFFLAVRLYLIEILHQTTTRVTTKWRSCTLYLIEILHQTTTRVTTKWRSCTLYLIEILHQTTTSFYCGWFSQRCILSKFYIKPQRALAFRCSFCVVSYRNSTSNHNFEYGPWEGTEVVSYRNPTSNHNSVFRMLTSRMLYLIEILHQTTTVRLRVWHASRLYLIEILHQTTTNSWHRWP